MINSDSDDEPIVKSKTTPSHLEVSRRVSSTSSGTSPSISSNVSTTSNECEHNTLFIYIYIILSLLASPLPRVSTDKSSSIDSAVVMLNEEEEDEVKEKEDVFKLGFQFRKLVKQLVEQQVCE